MRKIEIVIMCAVILLILFVGVTTTCDRYNDNIPKCDICQEVLCRGKGWQYGKYWAGNRCNLIIRRLSGIVLDKTYPSGVELRDRERCEWEVWFVKRMVEVRKQKERAGWGK